MHNVSPSQQKQATLTDPVLAFNKPFGVLCQFTDDEGRATLADYIQAPGYYPAGRLDKDSEGLLLLTNNGRLQQRISDPAFKLSKQYLVQVEGDIDELSINKLTTGVTLKDGPARALCAHPCAENERLWPRVPPVRKRQRIPTSWIQLTLKEGRNRQVRRMTAAVGFPTLRLIRVSIGNVSVWSIEPGKFTFIQAADVFQTKAANRP